MCVNMFTDNLTALLVLGVGILFTWLISRRPQGIPPGPGPVWPLLGNVLSVGSDPVKRFKEWREKYGDIFSFYIGQRLVIVLNGFSVLQEALAKRGDEFSSRPKMFMFDMYDGISCTSGREWKERRRFALSTLRDFGLGRNILEDRIHEETQFFLKAIEKQKGQNIEFTSLVQTTTSNIICSIVFGKRFEYDDPSFMKYMEIIDESVRRSNGIALVSFFPLLRYIPGDVFRLNTVQRCVKYTDEHFLKPEIDHHIKNYDENNINDFIFAYIREIKLREGLGEETSINYNSITRVISDLFVGGTETTSTTLRWAVLFLIRNPVIQEKCHQEIKETIGLERLPRMSDKVNMPYMEATVTEVQRLGATLPFTLFRTVTRDVVLNGFTIPKESIIIPNLSSALKDPKLFEKPDEFRPERFLDANGKFVKHEAVIPFAMGKRNCLGESLARMELFLFLTAMIQRFKFEQPEGEAPPSMEAVLGATSCPKPFNFQAVDRLMC